MNVYNRSLLSLTRARASCTAWLGPLYSRTDHLGDTVLKLNTPINKNNNLLNINLPLEFLWLVTPLSDILKKSW